MPAAPSSGEITHTLIDYLNILFIAILAFPLESARIFVLLLRRRIPIWSCLRGVVAGLPYCRFSLLFWLHPLVVVRPPS